MVNGDDELYVIELCDAADKAVKVLERLAPDNPMSIAARERLRILTTGWYNSGSDDRTGRINSSALNQALENSKPLDALYKILMEGKNETGDEV